MQFSLAALVLLSMSVVQAKLDLSQGIRILCFGDSLTEGWIAPGYPIHPYAISLNSELQKAFPNTTISISNEGLGGDQVHSPPGQFLPRINTICECNLSQVANRYLELMTRKTEIVMRDTTSRSCWVVPMTFSMVANQALSTALSRKCGM